MPDANLGMLGIDSLFFWDMQVEHDIISQNFCVKTISANLFSKAKQAFANTFAPAMAVVSA